MITGLNVSFASAGLSFKSGVFYETFLEVEATERTSIAFSASSSTSVRTKRTFEFRFELSGDFSKLGSDTPIKMNIGQIEWSKTLSDDPSWKPGKRQAQICSYDDIGNGIKIQRDQLNLEWSRSKIWGKFYSDDSAIGNLEQYGHDSDIPKGIVNVKLEIGEENVTRSFQFESKVKRFQPIDTPSYGEKHISIDSFGKLIKD